jgi:TPR repeat protein
MSVNTVPHACCLALLLLTVCGAGAQDAAALEEGAAAIYREDYVSAMRLLRPLAERGDAAAENALGSLYLHGWGGERDVQKAIGWFRKAAGRGLPAAQYSVGAMYADGHGVEKNFAEAAQWFRRAAEQGMAQAQIALGTLYGRGDGVPRDAAEAMRWYRAAAQQGQPDAQWRIGTMYAYGDGMPADLVEAARWFRQAASGGHPNGSFWLGHLYLHGLGVAPNAPEAVRWFVLAVGQARAAGMRWEAVEPDAAGAANSPMHVSMRMTIALDAAKNSAAAGALLASALQASAADLALSYGAVRQTLAALPFAAGGGAAKAPSRTMREDDAPGPALRERLSLYGEAILFRGYRTLAAGYRASATPPCARIQSLWAGAVREGTAGGAFDAAQNGFVFELAPRSASGVDPAVFKVSGVIVESTLAFFDPGNSDFVFFGDIARQAITVRPDAVATLGAWPAWAPAPGKPDLAACVVTLLPLPR